MCAGPHEIWVSNYYLIIAGLYVLVLHLSTAAKSVVQGDTNVIISCNFLNHKSITLYWRINNKDYDLYSVPAGEFKIDQNVLKLAYVTMDIDQWTMQCFTIDFTNEDNLNLGEFIVLDVRKSFKITSHA